MILKEKRIYTFVAVHDRYQHECGDVGVLRFFEESFATCVQANGCYSPRLESWEPLSSREVKSIGLTRHADTTWYRLNGSAIEGCLVGAVES
jgi:hypothetical protein